jgi:dTDP-glucose pyrophosphorylase
MSLVDLQQACVSARATVREALEVVDRAAAAVCLLIDDDGRLAGLLTDGDARRALLGGASMEDSALPFATLTPQTVAAGSPRPLVLDLMRALRIIAVPEVDADRHVVGLHTLSDVVGSEPLPNVAVIMAGGKGTRLGELTRDTPKPLMTVAGRSIVEWIVLNLVGGGVREIYVSVNHLAEQIVDHLGDGSRLGCSVEYLREEPAHPLGTAGSLTLLRAARPVLVEPVIVMNGDLMVQFDPAQLLQAHARSGAQITMATRSYRHEIPFGVVETATNNSTVTAVSEKPTVSVDINAGVYAVSHAALALLAEGQPSTMPELVQMCLDRHDRVEAWPISSEWIDVGTPWDLARAKGQA